MNAVNSVQLFLLVFIFAAVCKADADVCRVSCDDVTGTVGEDVIFNCSISQKCSECCITVYKFQYTEKYETICREDFPQDSCEQRKSFTCRYTPTTAMTGQFRFFLQTRCEPIQTEFTVNITDASKPVTAFLKKEHLESNTEAGPRSSGTVILAVGGVFIILVIIIIIIIMTIINKTKSTFKKNYIQPCGFQKRMFWGHRHGDDNDNSNFPENGITDSTV